MKFDFNDIPFAEMPGTIGSNAERVEPAGKMRLEPNGSEISRISPPLSEVPDFDFSKSVEGVSDKDSESSPPTPLTNNSGTTELFDLSSRRDFGHEPVSPSYTERYVDFFLDQSKGKFTKPDSITDFYKDLASEFTLKRTLAINKKTADNHGRT